NAGETTFPPRAPFFAIRRAVDDSSRCGCAEDDLAEVRAKPAPPSNQSLGPGRGVVHPAPGDHRRDDGYGRVVPRIAVEDDEVGGIPRQQLAAPASAAGRTVIVSSASSSETPRAAAAPRSASGSRSASSRPEP